MVMCIFSMGLAGSAFTLFITEPDIYCFVVLVIFSFTWWKSISGMFKYIVRLQSMEEGAEKNDSKRED